MSASLWFEGEGVYVPHAEGESVIWLRDTTGDPWVGVQVNSPQHASIFANVFMQTGKNRLGYLAQKGR